jgi:hypothetical protein
MSKIIVFMPYFSKTPVEAALSIFNVAFLRKYFYRKLKRKEVDCH